MAPGNEISMQGLHQNRDLSLQLLIEAAEIYEKEYRERDSFNIYEVQGAGNAALLFEFDELMLRFTNLLQGITPEIYRSNNLGISGNDDVPQYARELRPLQDIQTDYPLFTEDYAATVIQKSGAHLLPCLDRDYKAAYALAETELSKEDVALTQAILGDFQLAIESSKLLSDQFRRESVHFVVAIELYRHNRRTEAEEIHNRFLGKWHLTQLALGVANRVPWIGYPYPDW